MSNNLRVNREIRSPEVRLVDQNGNMVGIVSINDALKMSFEAGLDLVEVSPNANPPVCKIISYSKSKYEEQKKANQAKKKQKVIDTKEIKMSLNIGDGDFNTKIKQSIKFIEKGDKVKFNFVFRGREITYSDSAQVIIDKILEAVQDIAKLDEKPKLEGKRLYFTIAPINNKN